MAEALVILFALLFLIAVIKGTLRVFSKNFWLALLMLIVLTPLFFLWALVEGIFGND
jgi:hypothetical protein